jgi:isoleucyl-tRNA synthetase
MDRYEITKAVRLFSDFVDDLSNWYIRRSRKREFSQQLHSLLFSLSKLLAPFLPFLAEYLYQKLRDKKNPESVHLCDYPQPNKKLINKKLEEKMEKVREIVALALAKRAKAKIKVRQPLNELRIKNDELQKEKELLDLIKEELNVKKIVFDRRIKDRVELDTKLTPELEKEGLMREIIRQIQEMRKKANLTPKDKIIVYCLGTTDMIELLEKNKKTLLKETFSKKINFLDAKQNDFLCEKELSFNSSRIKLGIKKINLKNAPLN